MKRFCPGGPLGSAYSPTRRSNRCIPDWLHWAGPLILVIALVFHGLVYWHWPTYALQIDVLVYRFGGLRVHDHLDLYSIGRNGQVDDLLFTYTPFAALCFVPLALISDAQAQVLALMICPLLLAYSIWRILVSLQVKASQGLWALVALLVGLLSWLEPVRLSVQLGQINLLILAVILTDMLASSQSKWSGIGIGIVAGIKLTPGIFILYLLITGRQRAALRALMTLLGTILIGFIVLPSDSQYYWFNHGFANLSRIARDPAVSTSIRGLVIRTGLPIELGIILSVAMLIAGLAIAGLAYQHNHDVLGISLTGMTSAAISPFTWSHHWIWFVPLVVFLAYEGYIQKYRSAVWAMWGFCGLFASWFTSLQGKTPDSGWISLRPGGIWNELIPSTYVFVLLIILIIASGYLIHSPQKR